MPKMWLNEYIANLGRFEARESLRLSSAVAVGSGAATKADRERIAAQWTVLANGGRLVEHPGFKVESIHDLFRFVNAVGFAVDVVDKEGTRLIYNDKGELIRSVQVAGADGPTLEVPPLELVPAPAQTWIPVPLGREVGPA